MDYKINIDPSILNGLKSTNIPLMIIGEIYREHKGDRANLSMDWQLRLAKKNNILRLEVLACIEDMKRTGLLERESMCIYRINQDYIKEGKITKFI